MLIMVLIQIAKESVHPFVHWSFGPSYLIKSVWTKKCEFVILGQFGGHIWTFGSVWNFGRSLGGTLIDSDHSYELTSAP